MTKFPSFLLIHRQKWNEPIPSCHVLLSTVSLHFTFVWLLVFLSKDIKVYTTVFKLQVIQKSEVGNPGATKQVEMKKRVLREWMKKDNQPKKDQADTGVPIDHNWKRN